MKKAWKLVTVFVGAGMMVLIGLSFVSAADTVISSQELLEEIQQLRQQKQHLEKMVDFLEGKDIQGRDRMSEQEYYRILRERLPDLPLTDEEYYKNVMVRVRRAPTYGKALRVLETYIAYFPDGKYSDIVRNEIEIRKIKVRQIQAKTEWQSVEKRLSGKLSGEEQLDILKAFLEKFPDGDYAVKARVLMRKLLKPKQEPRK